jgi:hypothetical protein
MVSTRFKTSSTLLAGTLLAAACELAQVTVASPTSTAVVHAVLNPDATEQVILVESSLTGRVTINDSLRFDPLDPIRTAGGEPITGADVRLLTDADTVGVRAPETLNAGRGTGRYAAPRAAIAIVPGRSYRLRIRLRDGRELTGETRVPNASPGWIPGAIPTGVVTLNRSTDSLRLSWSPTTDTRTYGIRIETPNGPWFLFSDSTRFTLAGSLRNFFAQGLPSVWSPGFDQVATVVAVDRNFYDYGRSGNDPFGGTGLISSVRGGIGLFGAIRSLDRRVVQVRERDRFPLDARWIGTTSTGSTVEHDLWIETPGTNASSVTGRVRTEANRYLFGTLVGETLRLATIRGISITDTVSFFIGRVSGDSIVGSYDGRFATTGPRSWRRAARVVP